MSSARSRVFATPELLEAILAQLPPRALLFAQGISRHFQTTITTSPTLQQLLFLRAAPLNHPKKWSLNPLLRELLTPFFVVAPADQWALPMYESIEMMDCFSNPTKSAAFLSKEASWRSMLLVQPPPKVLHITRFLHAQVGDYAYDATHVPPTGTLTTGAIYDIAESFTRDNEFSSFGLSVLEEEAGVKVTLYLLSTAQCCPSERERKADLRSKGAEVLFTDLGFQRREDEGPGWRLDMTWQTDLSVEKGGVDYVEFGSWMRRRAPISSLLSDVR
jgi:hypothetical protein